MYCNTVPMSDKTCAPVREHTKSPQNPAHLSPLLERLFPPGVVGAELRIAGDPSQLLADEVQSLEYAVPERMQEFAAGRSCARRALAEFGLIDKPLRMDHDRRPHWPAPMIGSISHTTGMCGAVVAKRDRFSAIGMDMEVIAHVEPEVWPHICTAEENIWLASLAGQQRARCAALIFSAKESFFKCHNNLAQQRIEFDDFTLHPVFSDATSGSYDLRPQTSVAMLERSSVRMTGRFVFYDNLVMTGMVL